MSNLSDLLARNWELATSALFLGAVLTGLAMAVAGGSLGVFVLLRREAMLVVAVPQVVLVGVAAGLRWLGPSGGEPSAAEAWLAGRLGGPERFARLAAHVGWPTLPAALAAVAVALLLAALGRPRRGERGGATRAAAVVLPALYAAALCGAVLLVFGTAEHWTDLQKRYVGVDVAVDDDLAAVTVPALAAIGLAAAACWRRWLLVAQAPSAALLAGVRPARWDAGFVALLATALLLGTNALGGVTVTALTFLPAAAILPWARRVPPAVAASVTLAALTYAAGFVLSNEQGWPLGHSVGGVGAAAFLLSYLASRAFA